jgi:GT2 family glycosyltransferase
MEKIFPVDTKRRSFAKIIFRMVINPRYFLKNPNKRNLEKFGHYFRTAEPAIAEEKIEKKISVASKKNEVHHIEVEFYENMTLDRIEYLNFPSYGQVLVSIIIPVRNKWQYTYRCLKSVLKNSKHVPYEIIIANDASTDETSEMLKRITGIETINNQANQGFLKNCNNAVRYAKGKYILFLNNDTEVKEQWLQNLVEIAERDDKVGVVGGKILFPDGRLQEAGSIMDGEGWGQPYGRFDDPDRYEYNYVKETDLITGACLLIRKDGFLKIRGFDERYAPAFYEEFDLEFAMREIGYKIIYQPKAVIVHHQSSSYESEIRDSLSTINHSKFMKKWANRIWGQNSNSGVFLSRDRSKDKKVILFFDEKVPDYDKHAGSLSTYQYIKLLHEMGFKLIFIPDSLKPLEPYATELQQAGIEVVYGPFEFESWIKCNGQYIHYVWLSRPDVAIKYVEAIRRYTEAKILYYTVDLHYLRALRRYQIEKGKEILDESIRLKKIEFYLFENVDVILTPSDQEQKIIREGFPQKRIVTIPVIYYEANSIVGQNLTDFDGRHGIIFLGGFDHLPNVDAVKWFISDIFPVIKGKLPQIKLYIAGSNPPPEIAALNNNDIIVMGYVKDLEQIFKTKRVFVSPLRYGAGVKGKIITSMSYGVPVVTTCVGNEGINLRNGIEAFVVDDPVEFADRTVELYTNAELRSNFSRNSLLFVKNNFSKVKAKNMMLDVCGIIREKCSVCGALINFSPADTVENLRETTVCHFCSSLSRTIDLAECILKVNDIPLTSSLLQSLEKFKDLHIYELAHMGPIYEIFSRSPHFTWSEYFEEVTPGTFGPSGVRCEDVQQLTFKDNTFDLIISQDVFEHVPDPKRGFREIFRVLKPGGYHVFTVPFDRNTPKSVTRAIIGTTKELKHILDPIHHGDPIRSEGALVFSDFGRDLIDTLNSTGFEVEICERHYPRYRGGYNAVFLTKKRA